MNDIEYLELYAKLTYSELHSNQEVKEYNKKLVNEYPFLLPHNRWTDKVDDKYDYSHTELDAMPEGWRKAFGIQLCKELKQELIKANYLKDYRITQIKEKYGTLRWYDFGNTEEGYKIIDKYEKLSGHTCINCGKPAKYISKGWISPFCEDCANELKEEYEYDFDTIEEEVD